MSNDLISRKALLKNIDEHVAHAERHMWNEPEEGCPITKLAMEVIKEQPTAYDIDKVVGRLEEELVRPIDDCNLKINGKQASDREVIACKVGIKYAIEIVKGE